MTVNHFEEENFSNTRIDGKILSRMLKLARPYWKWFIGFILAIIMVSSLDSYFTFLSKRIVDEGILAGNQDALIHILMIYSALILVQAGGVFAFIYLVAIVGERIRYDLRREMFNHLQELSLSYYSKTPVGWIISRVTSDTERVADLLTWGVIDSAWAIMNILTSMIFMLLINWRLALIVFVSLPILLYVAIEFRKRILSQFRIVRKLNSEITGAYNENITGVRVVKALGREQENLREFGQLSGSMYRAGYRAAWLSALFLPAVQLISAFALGSIIWYSGARTVYGGITIGGIQAFISYITFMMWPIQDLARVFAEMQRSIASAERIFSLIDSEPEIKDLPGAIDPGSIQGDIAFDHVTFYYEDENIPVLDDFNLQVKRGENIALVGSTGGGKTTTVNLLCRFYEPKEGNIYIGGRDYRKFSMHALQSRIGIVPQTPHLFSGTIRENIQYGCLNATAEEIENAAKIVGAHDFIIRFEHSYDEQVGEGGGKLSVGQKQLISLARAVLANPEIFIMDEATSSVDTITEALIQKGMETLMEGRTSFIIAHRLSTIKKADRILVIEDGKIVEMGTHRELLLQKGRYYQLYTKQFRSQFQNAIERFGNNSQSIQA